MALCLVAFFVRTFVGEAALVPTSSMEGTILVGDHIVLNKSLYGPQIPFTSIRLPRLAKIRRGDIIAFHYPVDPTLNFLKRVAAVGGDVVEIRDGILYVNAVPVREPYVQHARKWWQRPDENMNARMVPPGELFVLGDNRDNSDDSRYWGTVPEQNVIGEPLLVYWSYDAPSKAWKDDSAWRQAAFYISIIPHIAQRSRWERTGRMLW
jgi:signal peptidase I